ncbi:MAG: glycoside hydrolase [Armatimonadetes bacterium]|nr:glycoside hydrolase [Armatimonadota bacterium]
MDASKLPRWRGFNLLEKFTDRMNAPFVEADFEWLAEWGFDFVRLPLSYWCWAKPDPDHWLEMDEAVLAEIDQCVEFGRQYGIHVNINFHRGPGYCVNPPEEPLDLWTDEAALEACAFHWARFAERYKGMPNERVTFDLLNEPAALSEDVYVRVCARLVGAIREQDPDRLIIADGLLWGNQPVPGLVGLGVAQSTRGYQPMQISHYKASWVRSEGWAEPTWPLVLGNEVWDRDRLQRQQVEPWQALEARGVGVHVGEWGAFCHTPHAVVLAWMRDQLELWKAAGWGWAMWNFRGSFGILDSGREDVEYEDFRGHRLDREMLELIRQY